MNEIKPIKKNNLNLEKDFSTSVFDSFFNDDFFININNLQDNFNVSLKEKENMYLIEASLPGVNKDDINIDFYDDYLTISAKQNYSIEDNSENYIKKEVHYGEFRRSFYINNIKEDEINASFKDDLLKITLPKSNDKPSRNKKININ